MKFINRISLLVIGLCLALSLQAQTRDQLPPKREFRCSWLTTVWAIDWPQSHSRPNASGQQAQQQELIAVIDSLAKANMNAVLFQVRGFSDAMYNSKYEPWSKYLTGTRGKAPDYDPLALLVEYAHYKGIEVHVWLNPYRYSSSDDTYGKNHEKDYHNTHPEWLVNCGGITILNPALPEVREQICNVVADIVENYDIDGVIFDDYFHQRRPLSVLNSIKMATLYRITGDMRKAISPLLWQTITPSELKAKTVSKIRARPTTMLTVES